MESVQLASVEVAVYRVPIETPVQTSFGLMRHRAAVLVRVVDESGISGLGEVWCNFPTVGAEHRARLLIESVAPLALSRRWDSVPACHAELTRALRILAVQSGEPGPIAQAIAGIDIALWDLVAKRAGLPLWRLLGGQSPAVGVYASGLNPTHPERLASQKAQEGFTAFKLKVGFGVERDVANLGALRAAVGSSATLMVDANQAWDVDEAIATARRLLPFAPRWLEEPIPADAPLAHWERLARECDIPLAAGENLRADDFDRFLQAKVLAVLQPDVAKWGGFSGCHPLGAAAAGASAMLCPHWLGGGIGLLATLHLKAAVGGPGFAEVDANPNPLRELLAGELPAVRDGSVTLSERPGHGAEPDLEALRPYQVATAAVSR